MKQTFQLDDTEYSRDLNIAKGVVTQTALFLHKKTGRALDECTAFVRSSVMEGGDCQFNDRKMVTLTKNANQDRLITEMTFNQYIGNVVVNNLIVAPSMTAYLPPSVKRSVAGDYLRAKKKERGKLKHEGGLAYQAKDFILASQKNRAQTVAKIKINSYSGASASLGTPLFQKSNHPALTSTCRCGTATGTATVEKFISGNRHLFNAEITLSNIIATLELTDYAQFEECMELYNLVYPSVDNVRTTLEYSTKLYWTWHTGTENINSLIDTLTPLERAIIVYSNDLYHIKVFNPTFIKSFLSELMTKGDGKIDNPDHWADLLDTDHTIIVSYLCASELTGSSIPNIKKEHYDTKYKVYASTAQRFLGTLESYHKFIRCMFVNRVAPNSIPAAPTATRRTAVVSDTDSTIFTVEKWIEWFNDGKYIHSEESTALGNLMIYLAGQVVTHQLAMYSTNMGIEVDDLKSFGMKSEFAYPVMIVTNKAKHYVSFQAACEGNVFDKLKYDAKGVTLRNSKIPVEIRDNIEKFIQNLLHTFLSGEAISLITMQRVIASIEWDIYRSVMAADTAYLTYSKVKAAASYKNPSSSPYMQYVLWEEVFAKHYGAAPEPEYAAIKISVGLNTKSKLARYLDTLENVQIANDLRDYMGKYNKNGLTQFLLPTDVVRAIGIPSEILGACDIRKLIHSNCEAFYLILETMGCYMENSSNSKLCMDLFPDENVVGPTIVPELLNVNAFYRGQTAIL